TSSRGVCGACASTPASPSPNGPEPGAARSSIARSSNACSSARASTSTPRMRSAGRDRLSASAKDPPIKPIPTMPMRCMEQVVQWTGVFWRKKTYDRTAVLDAADKARGRGSIRKAISGYSKILQQDPNDHLVPARVAPLFAKVRRWQESRKSFDAAAAGYLKQGFADKAIALWRVAA